MLLQDLPNDILLDTLIYLEPTDIFSLRKTCRRLQAFTSEREVWTNIYTNCLFFLPPGPLFTQSVPNLERIILRVYRLHAIWVNSSNLGKPSSVFLTFRHILSSKIRDAAFLRIYRSRYLVIGGAYGFLIYDLQANCEIFRHKGKPDERLFWLHSFGFRMVDHDNKDSFILFGKMRKGAQTSSLAMCKLNPLGHAFIVDTANMPTFISVGSEFCVLRNGSGHSLLHISTQKAYPFASTAVPSLNTRAIFLPGHVLLSYTLDPTRSLYTGTYFEVFTLPDYDTIEAGTSLHPTHSSLFEHLIREPTLISFDVSSGNKPPSLWLVVILDQGVHPLRITLQPNATMTFYLPENQTAMIPGASMNGAMFTVGPGCRAIGAAQVGYNRSLVAMYRVYPDPDSDGDLRIDTTCIKVPQLHGMHRYTFDPFVGIVAVAEDGEVHMIDFV